MYQRAPGTLARRTPTSLVVLAPSAVAPVRISGSPVVVWDLLAKPTRGPALLEAVVQLVDGLPAAVEGDLADALEVLIAAGVVVETS